MPPIPPRKGFSEATKALLARAGGVQPQKAVITPVTLVDASCAAPGAIVCIGCNDSGVASNGQPCYPCKMNGRLEKQ